MGKCPWYQKSHNKYINANTSLKGTKLFYTIIMYFYVKTRTITLCCLIFKNVITLHINIVCKIRIFLIELDSYLSETFQNHAAETDLRLPVL